MVALLSGWYWNHRRISRRKLQQVLIILSTALWFVSRRAGILLFTAG